MHPKSFFSLFFSLWVLAAVAAPVPPSNTLTPPVKINGLDGRHHKHPSNKTDDPAPTHAPPSTGVPPTKAPPDKRALVALPSIGVLPAKAPPPKSAPVNVTATTGNATAPTHAPLSLGVGFPARAIDAKSSPTHAPHSKGVSPTKAGPPESAPTHSPHSKGVAVQAPAHGKAPGHGKAPAPVKAPGHGKAPAPVKAPN